VKIYIAASWKHEHAVRMLTDLLRARGWTVFSFVEKAGRDEDLAKNQKRDTFDEWVWSQAGDDKFHWDTDSCTHVDLVIYLGPSGTDAWAEVGAAWAAGVPVVGLHAKGEQAGLMRRMMTKWYNNHTEMLDEIAEMHSSPNSVKEKQT